MADHSKFVALANRLIEKHGRLVTLQKLSAGPADAAKPWLGAGVPTVAESIDLLAVFVPAAGSDLGKYISDESLLKRVNQVALVQPAQEGLELFEQMLDGSLFKIEWVQVLKPADQTVLYFMGVNR